MRRTRCQISVGAGATFATPYNEAPGWVQYTHPEGQLQFMYLHVYLTKLVYFFLGI